MDLTKAEVIDHHPYTTTQCLLHGDLAHVKQRTGVYMLNRERHLA